MQPTKLGGGQHRHQAEDERQFAIAAAVEIEANAAVAERLGLDYLDVVGGNR